MKPCESSLTPSTFPSLVTGAAHAPAQVGPLPAAMPLQLTTINLAHNDLSGTIPQAWASLPHLQRVWLQGNRIDGGCRTGPLPTWLFLMGRLLVLVALSAWRFGHPPLILRF